MDFATPASSRRSESSEDESLGSFEGYKTDSILRLVPPHSLESSGSAERHRVRKRRRRGTDGQEIVSPDDSRPIKITESDVEHGDDAQSGSDSELESGTSPESDTKPKSDTKIEGGTSPENDTEPENDAKPETEVLNELAEASPKLSKREQLIQFRSEFVPQSGSFKNLSYAVIRIRPTGIALHGTAWLSVISGRVNIHGATLTPLNPPILFQSPFEPLLVSRAHRGRISSRSRFQWPDTAAGAPADAAHHVMARSNLVKILSRFRGDDVHVFVTEVAKAYSAPPLCPDLPYTHIGRKYSKISLPNIPLFNFLELFHTIEPRLIAIPDSLAGVIPRSERLVIIGAGNSGKSTMARTVVNHIVTTGGDVGSFRSIVYVDVDVGQPDRGIPGVVAAHLVSEPSFARRSACRSVPLCARYFGDITPRENPTLFSKCVQIVVRSAREHAKRLRATMIVNTHGWTTGAGQGLLKELFVCLEPTIIVRMKGGSSERVAGTAAVAMDELLNGIPKKVRVESVEGRDARIPMSGKACDAPTERDLTVSAYFAFEFVTGRTMRVKTRDVRIIIAGVDLGFGNGLVPPQAAVGKVCGLGRLADGVPDDVKIETDMVDIVGYGLVRAVNNTGDWLFLATPLKGNVLSQCSILVVAAGVTTPGALIKLCASRHLDAGGVLGEGVPFCMLGVVVSGHGVRNRKYTMYGNNG